MKYTAVLTLALAAMALATPMPANDDKTGIVAKANGAANAANANANANTGATGATGAKANGGAAAAKANGGAAKANGGATAAKANGGAAKANGGAAGAKAQGGAAAPTKAAGAAPASKATGAAGAAGNAQQVQNSINKWLSDIKAVNTFVDTAGGLKSDQQISAAASTAFVAAQDEGTQNDFLASAVKLDSAGATANKALAAQFGVIGPAINDTISNPQNLQKNLAAINGARCPPPTGKGAIGQEGAVQASAAKVAGVTATAPEIPNACNA